MKNIFIKKKKKNVAEACPQKNDQLQYSHVYTLVIHMYNIYTYPKLARPISLPFSEMDKNSQTEKGAMN